MKKFFEVLFIRVAFYSVVICWFYFAVPALWDQGSSYALEFLFGLSFLFCVLSVHLEIGIVNIKLKNK